LTSPSADSITRVERGGRLLTVHAGFSLAVSRLNAEKRQRPTEQQKLRTTLQIQALFRPAT